MATITFETELIKVGCANCGIVFAMPKQLNSEFRSTHKTFYCPHGHANYYPQQTDEEKLLSALNKKEGELAQLTTKNIQLETQLSKVAEGKCPCCGKTFKSLEKHMKLKHPNKTQLK